MRLAPFSPQGSYMYAKWKYRFFPSLPCCVTLLIALLHMFEFEVIREWMCSHFGRNKIKFSVQCLSELMNHSVSHIYGVILPANDLSCPLNMT